MNEKEILNTMILAKLPHLTLANARQLYDKMESATAVLDNWESIPDFSNIAPKKLKEIFSNTDNMRAVAEQEMEFVSKNGIKPLCLASDDYPHRLRQCPDAPLVLFHLGNANLNASKIVSIIGTRKCSQQGREICDAFVSQLKEHHPNTLIVSGLAYGIDINAHRAALKQGMPTIGVLAHGLDRIYPAIHRATAVEMLEQGGLLTEYTSGTNPDRGNFVRRNRIVAGMADATIVVESARKGGSMITAELTNTYGRELFAFPGRISDESYSGCNNLIKSHKAQMIETAEDFLKAMNWEIRPKAGEAQQQELFLHLSEDETTVYNALKSADDKHINQIATDTSLPVYLASGVLYELECKGLVSAIGGGRYKLNSLGDKVKLS